MPTPVSVDTTRDSGSRGSWGTLDSIGTWVSGAVARNPGINPSGVLTRPCRLNRRRCLRRRSTLTFEELVEAALDSLPDNVLRSCSTTSLS